MPRAFLAPYRFKLVDSTNNYLIECLETLRTQPYSNESDRTILKCEEVKKITGDGPGKLVVCGNVKYGKYGNRMDVIDVESGQKTKDIAANESPLDQYMYLFDFQEIESGFLILQRIGNVGVRTILEKAINSLSDKKIVINPIILELKELLEKDIVEITLEIPKIPAPIEEKLRRSNLHIENQDTLKTIISLKAGRDKSILSNIKDRLREQLGNYDRANIGYIIDEKETLKVTVKVGESRRTINITAGKVRSWVEVEDVRTIQREAIDLLRKLRGMKDV